MRLTAGSWELVAAPERGGAILSLRRNGQDILRPTPPGAPGPFDTACFPLVPYANRIAFGRFSWDGVEHHLPRNHTAQKHPLHGVGWLRAWHLTANDAESAAMTMRHSGGRDWPWRFSATQRLSLSPNGLLAELEIVNEDDEAMPATLGFHPYFARIGASALSFEAAGLWLADDDMLPNVHTAAEVLGDWAVPRALEQADLIDHCYTGWRRRAVIARGDGDIALEATELPDLHLYLPPHEAFFCVEPVGAMPDAVNRRAAQSLAPGEHRRATLRIVTA